MSALILTIQDALWGWPLLISLFGAGLYFTFCFGGVQFRYLPYAFKQLFSADSEKPGDLSPFNALMTSLAGAIGTGTIVGVGTAIVHGGLGSLFWMWLTAIFGMSLKYAESYLAVYFRDEGAHGEMSGGPMHYMEKGLGWKRGAVAFASFGIFASLTTGNLVQANAIEVAVNQMFSLSPTSISLVLAALTGAAVLGGVQTIGKVSGVFVPIMAAFYLLAGGFILLCRVGELPEVLFSIFQAAFTPKAAVGGAAASMLAAFQMGVARSIFSNEAGLGISSIASASARTDHPVRQGLVSMTGVFISTLLVCTMTGLVLALHLKDFPSALAGNPAQMALDAFENGVPFGASLVSIGLLLFAYSTIIAWGFYGEKCLEYIAGVKYRYAFRGIFTLAVIPGVLLPLDLAWQLADIANALMILPNLLALYFLAPLVRDETRKFLSTSMHPHTAGS